MHDTHEDPLTRLRTLLEASTRAFLEDRRMVMLFLGIWIEKGMGLIIPGFVPTPLGEIVEYSPTLNETALAQAEQRLADPDR